MHVHVIYNLKGLACLAVGIVVGAIFGGAFDRPWIGVIAGAVVAGTLDVVIRIRTGGRDDLLDGARGPMLYHLPIWLYAAPAIVVAIIAHVATSSRAAPPVADPAAAPARSPAPQDLGSQPPRSIISIAARPAPLGIVKLAGTGDRATATITGWATPSQLLGIDEARIWLMTTRSKYSLPDAGATFDAVGVCEVEVYAEFDHEQTTDGLSFADALARAQDQTRDGRFAFDPALLAAAGAHTIVAIDARDCASTFAPTMLACTRDRCRDLGLVRQQLP